MGEVYRARDTTLDRDVAIKFLSPTFQADANRLARFEREARALAALQHPNVGAIYGFADDGTARGLVLELLEGETLAARLSRGPLPVREALRIGEQVASALSVAHCKGIVHRDLKPANIMLTGECFAKVLDFGLAKAIADPGAATGAAGSAMTEAGSVIGTPRYMSPEQARGRLVDARTDLWSLGCILYESLTGTPAFGGDTSVDTLSAVLNAEPNLSALPPDTPGAVASLIRRCLDKDPENRPATAGAVYAELEEALQRRPSEPPFARRRRTPVLVIAAVAAAAIVWTLWSGRNAGSGPPGARIRSIAVRPLENLSHDASQAYFAEGMTDALTTHLAKAGGLRVVSRTSATRFADKPVAEVARALNVDGVVEGSVLFVADRVRVSARLIDAASDTSLWADSYEGELGDVLQLQQTVARDIAQQIHVAAAPASASGSARGSKVNADAYREYLQGRYLWNRRTAESLQQAIAHFERAIELQPDYAPAHSGIAESLVLLSAPNVGSVSPKESLPRARAEALRALQLDNMLASAHAVLARERLQAWDWSAAESEAKRAVELEPNNADWHFWRAAVLATLGRHDQSIAEARAGIDLDPVSPIVGSGLSWMYHLAGQFDDALREAQHVLSYEPNFAIAHSRVGEALVALGKPAEAIAPFRRALEASGGSPDMLALLGHAQARAGRQADALATLDALRQLRRTRYVSEYDLVLVYAGLADTTQALDWLERACDAGAAAVPFINVDPAIDSLRGERRFRDIVRRIDLRPKTFFR